jgi:hypothetical protein
MKNTRKSAVIIGGLALAMMLTLNVVGRLQSRILDRWGSRSNVAILDRWGTI